MTAALDRLDLDRDGADWPMRAASQHVEAGGVRFHVQRLGREPHSAPALLMLHGTGATTHSWRRLVPLLAPRFDIVLLDLPGHGFSSLPRDGRGPGGMTLPGMAASIAALVKAIGVQPRLVVGHSAGAAILARMCIDRLIAPSVLISINGALLPFPGLAGQIFPPMAKLLWLNPLVPRLFAWRGQNPATVRGLLEGTGSRITEDDLAFYSRLFQSPGHVQGALTMMASWDLASLARDLPRLTVPTVLIAGGNDRAIRADDAFEVRARLPDAKVEYLKGLGHLAHEEDPAAIASIVFAADETADIAQRG